MTSLVEEFFTRDLSEAEHEALSKLLEGSPEAASRYEGLLEKNYLATGLPQPNIPQSLASLPHLGGSRLTVAGGTLKLLLVGLALVGTALWKFWPAPHAEISQPVQALAVEPVHKKAPAAKALPAVKQPAPIQPVEAGIGSEGQELSLEVDAPQRSLVTVRILDSSGKEVRALYAGFVEAGRWNFQWDGLLENGEAAGAGDYRIDVQTGAVHQTKDIRIQLRPTAP
jgi:hypothetical protein